MTNRRNFLGLSAAVILTPGLLMPVRKIIVPPTITSFGVDMGVKDECGCWVQITCGDGIVRWIPLWLHQGIAIPSRTIMIKGKIREEPWTPALPNLERA